MLTLALLGTLATAPVVVPLHPVAGTRLRAVRVQIAGDSADFLFDTGNGTTLIAKDLAERVGCTPVARTVGFRMTGERVGGFGCEDVRYELAGMRATARAGVVDMAALLGGDAHGLRGVLSLQAFAGHTVTLDLAHDRLIVETPASAAARTRTMRELVARLATGPSGADLDLFVGVPAGVGPRATTPWLEWDSGHQAPTFLAPHAAALLGVRDSVPRADAVLTLGGTPVTAPAVVKDVIYDGVLSAGLLERAVWTADLARGRLWVSDVAPIAALPRDSARQVAPPAVDPVGVYEAVATVQGKPQPGVLTIWREHGVLRGRLRGVGEERTQEVRDVRVDGATLAYEIAFGSPTPVRVTFDGLVGTGAWSDSAGHGGAMRMVKRS
jgi:hypothetical protein